jgi:hypothetical protein
MPKTGAKDLHTMWMYVHTYIYRYMYTCTCMYS